MKKLCWVWLCRFRDGSNKHQSRFCKGIPFIPKEWYSSDDTQRYGVTTLVIHEKKVPSLYFRVTFELKKNNRVWCWLDFTDEKAWCKRSRWEQAKSFLKKAHCSFELKFSSPAKPKRKESSFDLKFSWQYWSQNARRATVKQRDSPTFGLSNVKTLSDKNRKRCKQ